MQSHKTVCINWTRVVQCQVADWFSRFGNNDLHSLAHICRNVTITTSTARELSDTIRYMYVCHHCFTLTSDFTKCVMRISRIALKRKPKLWRNGTGAVGLTLKYTLPDIPARIIGWNSRGSAKSIEPVTYRLFHYKATVHVPWLVTNKYANVLSFLQLVFRSEINFAHLHLRPVLRRIRTRRRARTRILLQSRCRPFIAALRDLQRYDAKRFIRCLYRMS